VPSRPSNRSCKQMEGGSRGMYVSIVPS
jgi:hypothetical protein